MERRKNYSKKSARRSLPISAQRMHTRRQNVSTASSSPAFRISPLAQYTAICPCSNRRASSAPPVLRTAWSASTAMPRPSAHFVCNRCHRVMDLNDFDPTAEFLQKAAAQLHAQVDTCHLLLRGLCPACCTSAAGQANQ